MSKSKRRTASPPLPVLSGSPYQDNAFSRLSDRAEIACVVSVGGFLFSVLSLAAVMLIAGPGAFPRFTFVTFLCPLFQSVAIGLGIATWSHSRGRLAVLIASLILGAWGLAAVAILLP